MANGFGAPSAMIEAAVRIGAGATGTGTGAGSQPPPATAPTRTWPLLGDIGRKPSGAWAAVDGFPGEAVEVDRRPR